MKAPKIIAGSREITETLGRASGLLVEGDVVANATAELLAHLIDAMETDDQDVHEVRYLNPDLDLWDSVVVSGACGERPEWTAALKLARAVLDGGDA